MLVRIGWGRGVEIGFMRNTDSEWFNAWRDPLDSSLYVWFLFLHVVVSRY